MTNELLQLQERIATGISLGESHFRVFKSAYQRDREGNIEARPVKDVCRNIGTVLVAFANADGGELYIGVEDDGTVTSVPHNEQHIGAMTEAYRTHVHADTPLVPPVVRRIEIEGKIVIYFRVGKSAAQVRLTTDGRCLQRFDRENRPVAPEQIQYGRQEVASLEYDRGYVPQAEVSDLDLELLDEIAHQLSAGYSPEKLLQFLDLAEFGPSDMNLRRAALLLFARDIVQWHPRSEVRILRVDGTELKEGHDYNVLEDDTVRGNIVHILEEAWDRLRPHLARTRFQSDAVFRESIIYPEEACREAPVNAIAHRDYSAEGKPVEILIFDDRMEVRSPGALLSSLSVADLKELQGAHQSRNVFVARVMRELGYMREMGEGIRRIYRSVRESELVDPEIRSGVNSFSITLFHKSIFSPRDVQWLDGYNDFDLNKQEQRVVLLARDEKLISTQQIFDTLELIDTEDFRALYEQLHRKGLIYTAKERARRHPRKQPRFRVRPPVEAQQHLGELQKALLTIGPTSELGRNYAQRLQHFVSPESPYYRDPLRSLIALGYVNVERIALSKLRSLWSTSANQVSQSEPRVSEGRVVFVKGHYGFISSDVGETYYVHRSELDPPSEWEDMRKGTLVNFQVGDRSIQNRNKPAKRVRVIRPV
jgi:ATP-dependent DNA helicase RecG